MVATNSCRKNAQDQVGKKQTHPYGLLFDVKLSLRNFMELVNYHPSHHHHDHDEDDDDTAIVTCPTKESFLRRSLVEFLMFNSICLKKLIRLARKNIFEENTKYHPSHYQHLNMT